MADQLRFQQSDKEPVHPRFRINWWAFSLRELVVIAIVGTLMVICLILAGVLGRVKGQLANPRPASEVLGTGYCSSKACLRTAARAASYLNKSVDPCENFYQFACGNYKNTDRPNGVGSVYSEVMYENEGRILTVLREPVSEENDDAATKKAKNLFTSCNNMDRRQRDRGLPILQQVIPALGGWKVLGTWDSAKWDLNSALKKVQIDFMVFALYTSPAGRKQLYLRAGNTPYDLALYMLEHPKYYKKEIEDYKNKIRRIGSLLVDDAISLLNPPLGNFSRSERNQLLEEFVNDSFTMDSQLAKLREYRNWHRGVVEMSLDTFSSKSGGAIDWTSQITSMYDQAGVSGNTLLRIPNLKYFTGLNAYLGSLPEPKMKRILHNYFIWRVVDDNDMVLSWEYVHAAKDLAFDMHAATNFVPRSRRCVSLAQHFMTVAVDHLYITKFLSKENKDMAHEITDNIRLALKEQVTKTPWMDDSTKKVALKKMDQISIDIGYPKWLANQAKVDKLYRNIKTNATDFFGNLLRLRSIERTKWNLRLQGKGVPRHYPMTDARVYAYLARHYLGVEAGMLQFPYYDAHQPHSASFGALGAGVGNYMHRFVDDYGKHYDINGDWVYNEDRTMSWWSNSSLTKYKEVKQCVKKVYSNLTMTGPSEDGQWWKTQVDASGSHREAISVTSGLRLAVLGYRDWMKQRRRKERMLPGLHMTPNQMLFLSYAQSACEEKNEFVRYYSDYNIMDTENRVNMVLGQLEEFSQAFQCKKKAKMNHALKCQYF